MYHGKNFNKFHGTCPHCGKEFDRKYNLLQHIKWHTGEKENECKYCGKKFNGQSQLNKHYRTHERANSIKCFWCGQGFTYMGNMKQHAIKVHKIVVQSCKKIVNSDKVFISFSAITVKVLINGKVLVICVVENLSIVITYTRI